MSKLTPNEIIAMCRRGSPNCGHYNKIITIKHYLPGISAKQITDWTPDLLLKLLYSTKLDIRLVYIRLQLQLIDSIDATQLIATRLENDNIYYRGRSLRQQIRDEIDEVVGYNLAKELQDRSEENWGEVDFYEDVAGEITEDFAQDYRQYRYLVYTMPSFEVDFFTLDDKVAPDALVVIDKVNNVSGAKLINSTIEKAIDETYDEFVDQS